MVEAGLRLSIQYSDTNEIYRIGYFIDYLK